MEFNKKKKNNELIKLIKDSILTDKGKNDLLDFYERVGASSEFLKKFEDDLVARLKLRTKKAVELCKSVDDEFAKVEENYNKQREDLLKKLQKDIAKIEVVNVSARAKLWDAYYDKIDELQKDITAVIQKITQKTLIGFAE